MLWQVSLIVFYCASIAAASLLGGWLPAQVRLTHTMMQMTMSFVGGLMLGVALLHLIPHAAVELESMNALAGWTLAGLLCTFFMMRWFHFHQHDPQPESAHHDHHHPPAAAAGEPSCDEPHEHLISHLYHSDQPHQLSWVGLFFGLGVHTLLDGIALAASVAVGLHGDTATGFIGLATFLAILLHKPLDAFSITSVMVAAGWPRGWISAANLMFALLCPLGALCFYFGVRELAVSQHLVVGAALGFSAGVFLCISLADILPEVQFHRHDRLKLSMFLLLGVLVAMLIGFFEPEHAHSLPAESHAEESHAEGSHADHHEH